jgi:hypothetical protein
MVLLDPSLVSMSCSIGMCLTVPCKSTSQYRVYATACLVFDAICELRHANDELGLSAVHMFLLNLCYWETWLMVFCLPPANLCSAPSAFTLLAATKTWLLGLLVSKSLSLPLRLWPASPFAFFYDVRRLQSHTFCFAFMSDLCLQRVVSDILVCLGYCLHRPSPSDSRMQQDTKRHELR